MSCVLRAAGRDFDVDAFLHHSPLRPEGVYKRGDTTGSDPRTACGFDVGVSYSGFDDLEGQIGDAILFLDQNEEELRRLTGFEGVEVVSLDFSLRWRLGAVQTDTFPPELLWRAGALDIAITVTHYPMTD